MYSNKRLFVVVIATLNLLIGTAGAQTPTRLSDINTGNAPIASSDPGNSFGSLIVAAVEMDQFVLFAATDQAHGTELWRTDGTEAGTQLVMDILPGDRSSGPRSLTRFGDIAYFWADDGTHGHELWLSDGTTAGTRMVKDIRPGRLGQTRTNEEFVEYNGRVYFDALSVDGSSLWRTDGTAQGTEAVPAASGSRPAYLVVAGQGASQELLFTATVDAFTGRRVVFRLTAGDDIIAVQNGPISTIDLAVLGASNNVVAINGFSEGPYLYTLGDTSAVAPTRSAWIRSRLMTFDGSAYFAGEANQTGLYLVDELGNVELVKAFDTDIGNRFDSEKLRPVTVLDGRLIFQAETTEEGGELWSSDGTTDGTALIRDINPGANDSLPANVEPAIIAGQQLYFRARDPGGEEELWRTDGTEGGTVPIINLNGNNTSRPRPMAALNDKVVFSATDTGIGNELFISDGTFDGTNLLKNIAHDMGDSQVSNVQWLNERVIFTAYDDVNQAQLWAWDGSSTIPLTTAPVGALNDTHSRNWSTLAVGDLLYFFGDGSSKNLWRTDGTPAGTQQATDFDLTDDTDFSDFFSDPPNWVEHNGLLYVEAFGETASGLFQVDAAGINTLVIEAEVDDSRSFYQPPYVATTDDWLFWVDGNDQLWRSNGMPGNGTMISDNGNYFLPSKLIGLGDNLIFAALATNDSNWQLFRTNGFSPVQISDFGGRDAVSGAPDGPIFMTAHEGLLFFAQTDATNGFELWVTDGSFAGTRIVKDINPGSAGSYPTLLTSTPSGLYFAAQTVDGGSELWISDGTSSGTRQVADLAPGNRGGLPWEWGDFGFYYEGFNDDFGQPSWPLPPRVEFEPIADGRVVFRAWDDFGGSELWITDGNTPGTIPVSDIAPGRANANPGWFAARGNEVVFSADDGTTGRELWRIDFVRSNDLFSDGFEG